MINNIHFYDRVRVPSELLHFYITEIEEKVEEIEEYGSLEHLALQKIFNYELYEEFKNEDFFEALCELYKK